MKGREQYLALGCRLQSDRVAQGRGGESAPTQGQLIKAGRGPAQLLAVLLQQSFWQLHHCCCFLRSTCITPALLQLAACKVETMQAGRQVGRTFCFMKLWQYCRIPGNLLTLTEAAYARQLSVRHAMHDHGSLSHKVLLDVV